MMFLELYRGDKNWAEIEDYGVLYTGELNDYQFCQLCDLLGSNKEHVQVFSLDGPYIIYMVGDWIEEPSLLAKEIRKRLGIRCQIERYISKGPYDGGRFGRH